MTDTQAAPALIGDVGGTNVRFALVDADGTRDVRVFPCDRFHHLDHAISTYLADCGGPRPSRAALDVACPVTGDQVTMTNRAWSFSIAALKRSLGLDSLIVINDFEAVAHSVPRLTPADRVQVGGGEPRPGHTVGIIGPGTGLGVAGLVPVGKTWRPVAGEGGHATMPAIDDREAEILHRLRRHFPHVSAERVLNGDGLVALYRTIAALQNVEVPMCQPADVSQAALDGSSPLAVETVSTYCAMLGTVAGNLALTLGAHGGIFIAGGIVPKLGELFLTSGFRERFESKGRLSGYVRPIPTYLITHPLPAFLGLAAVLEDAAESG